MPFFSSQQTVKTIHVLYIPTISQQPKPDRASSHRKLPAHQLPPAICSTSHTPL